MTHGWPGSVIELLDTIGPLTDPTAHGGQRRGRVPSRPAVAARLRLLGRAGRDRLGPRPHRAGLGGADAPPRLHPLRRPGRRRRRRRHRRDGPPGARGPDRHPHQPARAGAGRRRCRRTPRRNAPRPRRSPPSGRSGFGYFVEHGHPAADDRLRPARLAGRARRLDGRPRHGRLLQDRAAPSSTGSPRQPHARPHPRQHHAVLADGHRRLGRSLLLGGLRAGRPGRRPAGLARVALPFAFTTFPGEIWQTPRSWVEASYPNVIYFNEVDKGGHFAAWEEPELFTTEVRAAFTSLR